MRHIFMLLMLILAGRLPSADVENEKLVVVGQNIEEASLFMKSFGNGGHLLDMETSKGTDLKMWQVGDGVLIAVHSDETKKILHLSYSMSDERPKSTRKTFNMSVKSFNPTSGEMLVVFPMANK